MTTLFAFLHHVAVVMLVAAIAVELALIRQDLTLSSARKLLATDAMLGASAGALLVIGLLRVFFFEKGASYYFSSSAFLAKLGIFIAVALLSIIPTRLFLSWRSALRGGQMPVLDTAKLRIAAQIIHVELAAMVLIVLFAAIMARGGWV